MSATLGTASRYSLTNRQPQTIPSPEEAKAISYPLIPHVDAQRENPIEFHAQSAGRQKRVNTELEPTASSPSQDAEYAIKQATAGARVLIIRNLVKDCTTTLRTLEEQLGTDSELLFKVNGAPAPDRKSTRLNSSHVAISYAVFCLKKKREEKIIQI